jgi:hypothetical protein
MPAPGDGKNEGQPASDLIQILRQKYPRTALAVAAGQAAWPAFQLAKGRYQKQRVFTVKVAGFDDVYDDVHAWVLGLLTPVEQRALIAYSGRTMPRGDDDDDEFDGDSDTAVSTSELKLRYDGNREQQINVGGYRVKVTVYEGGQAVAATGSGSGNGAAQSYVLKPPEIVFTATSHLGRNAVVAELSRLVEKRTAAATRKPRFRILGSWGGWDTMDDMPNRPLESVVLPDGQLDRIIADIERFLGKEAEYVRRGIPWHRAHLYAGTPGTGKTSIARALSSYFHLDLWYLTLSDLKNDSDLLRRFSQISTRSLVLIEDVDAVKQVHKRGKDNGERGGEADDFDGGGLTIAGILNALDGAGTPHGLITILTSNHADVLDDAMVRSGRVDLIEQFNVATLGQAVKLVSYYYDDSDIEAISQSLAVKAMDGAQPSSIIEACKRRDRWQDITPADLEEMEASRLAR